MKTINKFDQLADKYDTKERLQISKYVTQKILDEVDITDKVLLDYGCGTGQVSLPLANYLKELKLYDTSEGMRRVVEQKVTDLHLSNVQMVTLDTIGKSDIIILVQVLHHEKESQSLLESLYNLLKENGKLVIVDFAAEKTQLETKATHHGFNKEHLSNTLSSIGFSDVKSEVFYKGKNNFMHSDSEMFIMIGSK